MENKGSCGVIKLSPALGERKSGGGSCLGHLFGLLNDWSYQGGHNQVGQLPKFATLSLLLIFKQVQQLQGNLEECTTRIASAKEEIAFPREARINCSQRRKKEETSSGSGINRFWITGDSAILLFPSPVQWQFCNKYIYKNKLHTAPVQMPFELGIQIMEKLAGQWRSVQLIH